MYTSVWGERAYEKSCLYDLDKGKGPSEGKRKWIIMMVGKSSELTGATLYKEKDSKRQSEQYGQIQRC